MTIKNTEQTNCIGGKEHIKITDDDRGEILCQNCGIVFEEKTLTTNINEAISENQSGFMTLNRSTVKIGTSTVLSKKDANSKILNQSTFNKYKKHDTRVRTKFEKKNIENSIAVSKISEKVAIPPNVTADAINMLKEWSKRGRLKGRKRNVYACGALLYFCRKYSIPKSAKTLANVCSNANGLFINQNEVVNAKKELEQEFGYISNVQSLESYMPYLISKLGLEQHQAKLIEIAKAKKLDGRNPITLACAIIYQYGLENNIMLSQNKISNICEISAVGLRIALRAINSISS